MFNTELMTDHSHVFVTTPTPPLGRFAATAIALEIFLGLGAAGGGLALMAGPTGEILPIPVSALSGSTILVVLMAAVHAYAAPQYKVHSVAGFAPLALHGPPRLPKHLLD